MSEQKINNKPMQKRSGGPMGGGFGMPVEKAQNFKGSFKRLVSYLKPHRINLIIVLVFAILSTTFSIVAPKITAKATNKLQDGYMARMMLSKIGDGQKEGFKNIDKMMSEAQLKAADQIHKQMADVQKKAVNQIETQMAEMQKKMVNQLQQMQAAAMKPGANAAAIRAQARQMGPAAIGATQELMKLPMIDTITDPQKKVDVITKMFGLLAKIPNLEQNANENGQQISTENLSTALELLKLPNIDSISDLEKKNNTVADLIDILGKMPNTEQSSQQNQQIDPKMMASLKDFIMLPMINTAASADKKAEIIKKMTEMSSAMPKDNQQDDKKATQNEQQLDEKSVAAIQEFLKLPNLGELKNGDQKADTVQKITDLGKKAPVIYYFMFKDSIDNGSKEDASKEMKFTDDQVKGAIRAIRETNGEYDFRYIGMIALILIGIYIISSLFSVIMGLVMSGVAQKTVRDLRREVDNKLNRLPLKYFDMHPHGDILSRVTNDIDTISTTLQQSLTQIITSVITIIGYIIMMFTISGVLTLIVLATLPLYVIATAMIAKKSQKYFAAQQKELGELSGHVEEMYTGHKIVKAFGREKDSIEKFEEINVKLNSAGWKAQFVSGIMFPLMNFISNIGYVGISIVGGIWITRSILGLGDILAFIQYSRQFTMPIVQTANIANIIQSTIACSERVFEILDEEEEIPDGKDAVVLDNPKGEVKFKNVDFRYKEDVPLIENMNLDVKQGHTIAIVGPTGAGKTTLVNLLMRFYELNAGEVSIDDINIVNIKRSELRKMFGMVLQDTWLFNGTIKDNIAYGKENATMEGIVRAAKAAHADHFIRTLPEGYNTVLNEEGTNISQGQKQLLTIARAILADPAILILDEATSSVDTRTEVLIQKAMANLMEGRTSFVIAHRLSTIRDAELILVMNKGTIIEMGNHKELLAKGGFYADLYNSQFSGANLESEAV